MKILLVILFVFASNPIFAQLPYQCEAGIATRHDAFPAVLENKPWRVRDDVDGYIGVGEIQDLEQYYILYVPGKDGWSKYEMFSADVRAENHKEAASILWDGDWIADIGKATWLDAGLPSRPVRVILCRSFRV